MTDSDDDEDFGTIFGLAAPAKKNAGVPAQTCVAVPGPRKRTKIEHSYVCQKARKAKADKRKKELESATGEAVVAVVTAGGSRRMKREVALFRKAVETAKPDLKHILRMLEGDRTASGQESSPPLTDSDDEENKGLSNDEDDEDQETAEEICIVLL